MRNRHKFDAYYTSEKLTDVLVDKVLRFYAVPEATFIEPCNGIGSISDTLENYSWWEVKHRWDIDPELCEGGYTDIKDASLVESWEGVEVDWVVSNPPYTQPQCQQIIENSYNHACCGIAMLLRLSYDEPCNGRAEWLKNTPLSHQIIFNPRPRFRADTKGIDNVTSCWFVWVKPDFAELHNLKNTKKIYCADWNN